MSSMLSRDLADLSPATSASLELETMASKEGVLVLEAIEEGGGKLMFLPDRAVPAEHGGGGEASTSAPAAASYPVLARGV